MLKRPGFTAIVALVLAAALVYGVAQLFTLRFEHGDVYPAYSTLRADPLGAKAFYQALDELPGYDTRQNFRPLVRLHPAKPVTLIYAGVDRHSRWGEEEFREFQTIVASGTRVVFAFAPEEANEVENLPAKPEEKPAAAPAEAKKEPAPPVEVKKKDDGEKKKEPDKTKEEDEKSHTLKFDEVATRLGFTFHQRVDKKGARKEPKTAILASAASPLEPEFSWHSATYFGEFTPAWRTLYNSDGHAVVAERSLGEGSIVLAGDSFFLSNEALRRERCPRLLAWIVGPPREVVFDEEHHGIVEQANIAMLARKYRLHGLVAGALLAVALFIWQSSAPFLPPAASRLPDPGLVTGKSAGEGFINLIRRALPPSDLLATCAAEWRKAFDPDGKTPKAAQLENVLATDHNPVTAYKTISHVLSQKK